MPGIENSFNETRPSVFNPTSTIAKSFSIATMVPRMTAPSVGDRTEKLSSSSAAKSSRLGAARDVSLVWVAARAIKFLGSSKDAGRPLVCGLPHGVVPLWRVGFGIADDRSSKRLCRVSSTPGHRLERFLDLGTYKGEGGRQGGVYIQIGS